MAGLKLTGDELGSSPSQSAGGGASAGAVGGGGAVRTAASEPAVP